MKMRGKVGEDTFRRTRKKRGKYRMDIVLSAKSINKPMADRLYSNIGKVIRDMGLMMIVKPDLRLQDKASTRKPRRLKGVTGVLVE